MVDRKEARKCHKEFMKAGCREFATTWSKLEPADKEFFVGALTYAKEENKPLASDIHSFWLDYMLDKGWVFGVEFDRDNKKSDALVPYKNLNRGIRDRYTTFFKNK